MAEEETPITKIISSGLEMEISGGVGLEKTTTTPSSTVADIVSHHSSSPLVGSELVGTAGEKRVSNEALLGVRSRLQYPPIGRDLFSFSTNAGSGLVVNSNTAGLLFSTPGTPVTPIDSFSSPTQTISQSSLISSVLNAPEMLQRLGHMPAQSTLLAASPSGSNVSASQQPGSQTITIQEGHLVELLKLVAQATPPPPPMSGLDWLSQLTAALRPTPPPPPPPPPPPLTGMESLMSLLVEELKKQRRPQPILEPPCIC